MQIEPSKDAALPLAGWLMGMAESVAGAEELTARAFREHHLELRDRRLRLRVHRAPLGSSSLCVLTYGADVELDVGRNEDFFVEHFVTRGRAQILQDHSPTLCAPGRGAMVSATKAVSIRLTGECAIVGVRIERGVLESHLQLLTGHEVCTPIVFEDRVDLTRGPGARRHQLIRWAIEELEQTAPLGGPPLASCLEEAYLNALLTGQPHSHRHLVEKLQPDAGGAAVRRVEDYIRAHPERPIHSERLVSLAGVSTSALYDAFQRKLGTSPMRMLREVRLERVREELLCAEPGETVTAIAMRWGFTHLARFSGIYRARFGELPSQTLALARRAS
jgi:AraC-like DNA-binding protein